MLWLRGLPATLDAYDLLGEGLVRVGAGVTVPQLCLDEDLACRLVKAFIRDDREDMISRRVALMLLGGSQVDGSSN